MKGKSESGGPSGGPEDRRSSFGALEVVIWILGAMLLMVLVVGGFASARGLASRDLVSEAALSAAVFLGASALLLSRYPAESDFRRAIGARPVPAWLLLASLAIGVLVHVPADWLYELVQAKFPSSPEEIAERSALLKPEGLVHAAFLGLVLAALVPLSEEIFFRGAIFGALRRSRVSSIRAAVLTGVGFVVCHFEPKYWPALAFVAIVLSALRAASGSILPSLAVHVGFNLLTVVLNAMGVSDEELERILPVESALVCGVVLLTLLGGVGAWCRGEQAFRNRFAETRAPLPTVEEGG